MKTNSKYALGLLMILIMSMFSTHSYAQQTYIISGEVRSGKKGIDFTGGYVVIVENQMRADLDATGKYEFKSLTPGRYQLAVVFTGYGTIVKNVNLVDKNLSIKFTIRPLETTLETITLRSEKENEFGIYSMKPIESTTINAGRKSEVIDMDGMVANLATNNSRQIYAKVAGLNIWENDGAGLQLGIGGRGLSPSRSSNFNMRQNGYDISADALGYPENYYSPPSEAINRIEVIRGAAALQYGTQFGGMVNYELKKGPENKPFELVSRQTVGSFGLFNSFNSVGGNKGKVRYYAYYQYKTGEGWRPNSGFDSHIAHTNIQYAASKKFTISAEYTMMRYLANQPGGLTDALFDEDPRQSIRDRNWFKVNWNLAAINMTYKFNERNEINSRTFGLIAERDALGFLGQISRLDPNEERDLLSDDYMNIGNETRYIHKYDLFNDNLSAFLTGVRFYSGNTDRKQGDASKNDDADFTFLNPTQPEHSYYTFPSKNIAVFAENLFQLTSKLSITPGVRYEIIETNANGYYRMENRNRADSVIFSQLVEEERKNYRDFVLFGLGIGFKASKRLEVYANLSQNYRSINFNDMRVVNPNFRVDTLLKDESGYTADIGFRGNIPELLYFDVSAFLLVYNDRIGEVLKTDEELFTPYRYRTNVSDSRTYGLETFAELSINKLIKWKSPHHLSVFSNLSVMNAQYVNSDEEAFEGNEVELVPSFIFKTGLTWKYKRVKINCQYSFTHEQYTDATNAEFTSNAVNGLVPSYYIMDISGSYDLKRLSIQGGVNNLTNHIYFTRRASGYPGPGIIPSDGRNFYLTLQLRI